MKKKAFNMPIKMIPICVFDFETTGLDTSVAQPIQIACKLYNPRSLEPIPGSEFSEYCKPEKTCKIEPIVWQITKIDPKVIEAATDVKFVFNKFIEHVLSFNTEKNKWTAPIAAGHNIIGFDLPIVNNCMTKFCKKKNETVLFNRQHYIDTMDVVFPLFENTNDVVSYKLDTLRDFFGLSKETAHNAATDVEHCGLILMRILKFQREIAKRYLSKMKNCFKKETEELKELLIV